MIDDSQDGVVTVGLGEANDKVHGDLLEREGSWISGDLVHRGASAVGDDFVLLARSASLNVLCDPSSHVWPPVVPLGLGDGFVTSRVSGYESFVHYPHDLPFKRQVRRDC